MMQTLDTERIDYWAEKLLEEQELRRATNRWTAAVEAEEAIRTDITLELLEVSMAEDFDHLLHFTMKMVLKRSEALDTTTEQQAEKQLPTV